MDGARFKPHVTVARLKHPQEASSWVRLLDAYRGPAWVVDEVRLIASFLGEGPRNRPRHEVRGVVPARGMTMVCMRSCIAVTAAAARGRCSSDADSEPSPTSPQASPSPSSAAADTAPQGAWRIAVWLGLAVLPRRRESVQGVTFRIVCEAECVGTLETEGGVIRTVHWDGDELTGGAARRGVR